MKSFDKFRYGISSLREMAVGGYQTSIPPSLRKNSGQNKSDQRNEISPTAAADSSLKSSSKSGKGLNQNFGSLPPAGGTTADVRAKRAKASGNKNYVDDRFKNRGGGVAGTIARNKTRAKKFASSSAGRKTGRALAGAGKELLQYKPDKERTDTGQGGMGTGLRAMTGVGQAAVAGAINAPAERINPKSRKTLGGKLLNVGKERFQKSIGVEPTGRTEQGRKVTGDTGKSAEKERQQNISTSRSKATGETKKEAEKKVKKEVEKNVTTGAEYKGASSGGKSKEKPKTKKTKITGDKEPSETGMDMLNQRVRNTQSSDEQDKEIENRRNNTPKKSNVNQSEDDKQTQERLRAGWSTRTTASSGGKRKQNKKKKNNSSSIVKSQPSTPTKSFTKFQQDSRPASERTIDVTPIEDDKPKLLSGGSSPRVANVTKRKRGQKKGSKQGRKATRASKKELTRNKANAEIIKLRKEETTMNLKEMNQIAARRELAKEKGGGKMRTYSQIKQDQLKTKRDAQVRSGQIVTVSDEYEYSHWREEFLWEVDKKYPDKVKEIKPMTGKNTITINPEDETSKYKRGY